MFASTAIRRTLRLTALSLALTATAACDRDELPEPEPEIARVVFSINGSSFTVNDAGVVTNGSTSIRVGAHQITAVAYDDRGVVIDEVANGIFELRGTSTNTAILEFTKGNAMLTGTLRAKAAGSAAVSFGLWHLEENHEDWGPFAINFTVTAS